MAQIKAPRGTADVLPSEASKWQSIERIAREVAELYHFAEIRTPIYESTELFHRGVGETTDIVQKETFTFRPRPESESITLRPEGTAGVVRAAIENGLLGQESSRAKVYYIGPNFRYERPQKGRLRIHHQFGVEAFGISEPEQDVECILLQLEFYRRCGVKDLALRVNSLGDAESKARYREELVRFLSPKKDSLSEDSQRRLAENPLRILDSKDPRDKEVCLGAPPASESLSEKSAGHFERVRKLLAGAQVNFSVDGALVRGFDYYTDTLWEVTAGGLGAQNAIGGGGRYDNLVEQLGGKATPGVGFGSGLERLLLALEGQNVTLLERRKPLVWLVSIGDAAREHNWQLMQELRLAGIVADMDPTGRSPKSQFKLADREKADYCLVVGESELAAGQVKLKHMGSGHEQAMARAAVAEALQRGE